MSSTTHVASKLEQRVIIRFLIYKNLPPIEIYLRIKNVYGEFTSSVQYVKKWYRKFKSGRKNIIDESHSGRPISVANKTLGNKDDTIIQCDLKARLSDIPYQVTVAYSIVQNIVTKKLKY